MSNQYKDPKTVPIDILCNRLNELAEHCSNGNISEFYMRIPAECDHDADIVLSEASNRLEAMQAKLDAQAEELAALRANLVRLESIESAATALVKCKGRYHAELNMKALIKAVEQKL